jgi:hypothetical protein
VAPIAKRRINLIEFTKPNRALYKHLRLCTIVLKRIINEHVFLTLALLSKKTSPRYFCYRFVKIVCVSGMSATRTKGRFTP